METLLKICQLFFLIMGIFGVIASSVSSFISMTVAATIYFMSAVISYYHGSWIPLVLGFFALLGMRYFGFETSGKDAREDALEHLSVATDPKLTTRADCTLTSICRAAAVVNRRSAQPAETDQI